MAKNNLVSIVFNRPWRGYTGGDLAGFTPELADRLVTDGVAVYKDAKKAPKPKAVPAEPEGDAPAEPEGDAPAEPEGDAPAEPKKPSLAEKLRGKK